MLLFFFVSTKVIAQNNSQKELKYTCQFNVTGLKSERDVRVVDELLKKNENVISSSTDYKTSKTKLIINAVIVNTREPGENIEMFRSILKPGGFDVDIQSFVWRTE